MKMQNQLHNREKSDKQLIWKPNLGKSPPQKNLKPSDKNLLGSPPQLDNLEYIESKRSCQSPPPIVRLNLQKITSTPTPLTSRKESGKVLPFDVNLIVKPRKENPNKSFDVRPTPSFITKGTKKNPQHQLLKNVSKDKLSDHKLSVGHQNGWNGRHSATPSFFREMINNNKSQVSSKENSFVKNPKNAFYNSAVSSNYGDSQKGNLKDSGKLALPLKTPHKTRSQVNFNPSKVPTFIRNKEYTKSQNRSNSNSKSSQKEDLFHMFKSAQVASHDTNENHEEFGIKINIKPAQKQRTMEDFQIIKELGEGSYGKAFLTIEKRLGFVCVIKSIDKQKLTEFEQNNLTREIKIQLFLSHQHITGLYGFFHDDQFIYLIMELLPSGNLKDQTKNKTLSEKQTARIVHQVCKGIDYMHDNQVLHRDLKPENIFMFDKYVKLGDFGCAVYSDITRNSFVGSPCYLSPQQLKNQFYDQKVDMWEIGTLTYEMLFKKCPFEKDILEMMQGQRKTENLSELKFPSRIPVSEEARNFIEKALEKNSCRRMTLKEALSHPFLEDNSKQLNFPKCFD